MNLLRKYQQGGTFTYPENPGFEYKKTTEGFVKRKQGEEKFYPVDTAQVSKLSKYYYTKYPNIAPTSAEKSDNTNIVNPGQQQGQQQGQLQTAKQRATALSAYRELQRGSLSQEEYDRIMFSVKNLDSGNEVNKTAVDRLFAATKTPMIKRSPIPTPETERMKKELEEADKWDSNILNPVTAVEHWVKTGEVLPAEYEFQLKNNIKATDVQPSIGARLADNFSPLRGLQDADYAIERGDVVDGFTEAIFSIPFIGGVKGVANASKALGKTTQAVSKPVVTLGESLLRNTRGKTAIIPAAGELLRTTGKISGEVGSMVTQGGKVLSKTPVPVLGNSAYQIKESSDIVNAPARVTPLNNYWSVLKPKVNSTPEIDWGKWNKEIPRNKKLMEEYNAIEQKAKADDTWIKNPVGINNAIVDHSIPAYKRRVIRAIPHPLNTTPKRPMLEKGDYNFMRAFEQKVSELTPEDFLDKSVSSAAVGDKLSYYRRLLRSHNTDGELLIKNFNNYIQGNSATFPAAINQFDVGRSVAPLHVQLVPSRPRTIRNQSGFSKAELLSNDKISPKSKDTVSKMEDRLFEGTVLKPDGEVVGQPKVNLIEIFTGDNKITPLTKEEYIRTFNENLNTLNTIVAKNNKSGVDYRIKELTADGQLLIETPKQKNNILTASQKKNIKHFEQDPKGFLKNTMGFENVDDIWYVKDPDTGKAVATDYTNWEEIMKDAKKEVSRSLNIPEGTNSWSVRIQPGQWTGQVQDIPDRNYLQNIPGLEMAISSAGVFPKSSGLTGIPGTKAYESINEYLKQLNLGRVKPGFNSQTTTVRDAQGNITRTGSRDVWEHFIKSNKAVGYYGDRNTIYGAMKSVLPYAIVGGAAAKVLSPSSEQTNNTRFTYKIGGLIKYGE